MSRVLSVLLLAIATSAWSQGAEPDWASARGAILVDYAKARPKDALREIKGPINRQSSEAFVRYYAVAFLDLADGGKSEEMVYADYRVVDGRWQPATVFVHGKRVRRPPKKG